MNAYFDPQPRFHGQKLTFTKEIRVPRDIFCNNTVIVGGNQIAYRAWKAKVYTGLVGFPFETLHSSGLYLFVVRGLRIDVFKVNLR